MPFKAELDIPPVNTERSLKCIAAAVTLCAAEADVKECIKDNCGLKHAYAVALSSVTASVTDISLRVCSLLIRRPRNFWMATVVIIAANIWEHEKTLSGADTVYGLHGVILARGDLV